MSYVFIPFNCCLIDYGNKKLQNQIKMSTQIKYRQDTKVSQADLNSNKANNNRNKLVVASAEYFSEWATERNSFENSKSEKTGNSIERSTGKSSQHRKITSADKWIYRNVNKNVSASYNEIYDRAELFIFP